MATLEHIAAMPAPTWHRLKMNDATLEVDDCLACAGTVEIERCGAINDEVDFDAAFDKAKEAWEAEHASYEYKENYRDEQAERLGGTALSAYQKSLDETEGSKDLSRMFEQGLGDEASSWMRTCAAKKHVVYCPAGEQGRARVRIAGVDGSINIADLDIVAGDGSELELIVSVDSPDEGQGVAGSTMRVFAGLGARVCITRVQTLDNTWTDVDDMGLFLAQGADVEIHQTVLGAGKAYTGLAGDLRGDGSDAEVVTRYLGHDDQELDFNYILRHHGKKTTCRLYANGVLAGASSKTLRGTIDLIRGAKGAEGQETDNVLLVDEDVSNKTVPTILCNEDDVMGNHGATIGHIRAEQLFYLASRGLSKEAAEEMFVAAALEEAWIEAPDETTRNAVKRLGCKLVEGFADVCTHEDEGEDERDGEAAEQGAKTKQSEAEAAAAKGAAS